VLQTENKQLRIRNSSQQELVDFEDDENNSDKKQYLVQSYTPDLMKKDLNFCDQSTVYCMTEPCK
jgi:hypothetical protein